MHTFVSFFLDPVLRAPTIGCMLMSFSAALVGVIVFLRKQSLIGETLSHATYPGVIFGVIIAAIIPLEQDHELQIATLIILGAFITALISLWCIQILENKWNIRTDSALCFILATFFGVGVTLASYLQFASPSFYKQSQSYLYGQAATMNDYHVILYAILSLIVVLLLAFLYKELQIITFDREYAKSLGIPIKKIDACLFILIALALVAGIRSVGVVLMSAMLVIPAASARQYTNKLSHMFMLAGCFALISGFFGNYFSVEGSTYFAQKYPTARISLPTGPMIVLVGAVICLFSLLFAPERGYLLRLIRIFLFQDRCISENLLKAMWQKRGKQPFSLDTIFEFQSASRIYLWFCLMRLIHNGWVEQYHHNAYALTVDGEARAAQIVRLHRLWEVYLADYLGMGSERVHRSAEEMEHILTPELEKELTLLLKDPKKDPHHQPIPPSPSF
ncbi:metal ABC transporter permease [Parachlamydia acanthamoebae]|uniref:metal ABC transporter permease n=1 Tax=Parachlamydia acanthamoebae TaxID=83552 RepID=UPI000751488A|nr:iron chelate uptake ABC transporter family permease subunit [Parachlamydia acanthamoebae]